MTIQQYEELNQYLNEFQEIQFLRDCGEIEFDAANDRLFQIAQIISHYN